MIMFVALHCVWLRTPLPDVNIQLVNRQLMHAVLQEVLEGADNILYEAKEDIPGIRFQKHGKENWVPVRAVLDSIHKDDIHYLKGCKSVRFFRSTDGTPSLSLHRGKCRFPTPIALRTRARSRHDT